MAAAITSPVAQMFFNSAVADIYNDGIAALEDSTGD
jgi:hypothetical protein